MYSEFGDKEGLFLACVNYYTLEERNLRTVQILTQEPLGIQNIEAFIEDRIDYALSDDCYGCLLVNTITEREVVSAKINETIDQITMAQEFLIFQCMEVAIKNKETLQSSDSEVLTGYLSCFVRGLMHMAKMPSKDTASLKKMEVVALSAIKG